jgi:hypothetical protein
MLCDQVAPIGNTPIEVSFIYRGEQFIYLFQEFYPKQTLHYRKSATCNHWLDLIIIVPPAIDALTWGRPALAPDVSPWLDVIKLI